ncbi:MAG TPA: HK97 gp10 family phage protein [Mycobacteriales bacterium]|nr:HK97 gp10 family phage protein [Mycobacteriales bacterium]
MGWRVDTSGFKRGLRRQKDAMHERAPEALAQAAEHISGVAAEQTPVETGRLAGSAAVHIEGDDTAAISYDGPYARYQHERLDLRHEHGNAKFLEKPMLSEKEKALQILARHLAGRGE